MTTEPLYNRYIMLYNTDYNLLYYSEDGISWNIISNNETISDIVYGNGKFLMLCKKYIDSDDNYCYIHYSDDGITWTSVNSMININMRYYKLAYGNNKFIIAGADTYYSKDGVTWSKSNSTNDYYVDYRGTSWVYFANNKFFAQFGSYICYLEDCSSYSSEKIMYVTENGDGYFHGNLEVSNEDTYVNIKPSGDKIMEIGNLSISDDLFYVTKEGELYIKGNISATSIELGENAEVSGKIAATSGNIGGWTINDTSISVINSDTNTGINLYSTGDIFSYGTNQWMWLNGGNLYFGIGQAVDFTKAYSHISSNGVYVASSKSTEVDKYLFEANANDDWVAISTHTPALSALFVYNDSNTDTSIVSGMASCVTMKTDYAGFSNRPLDVISTIGYDNGDSSEVHINVFGESKGSGDGSSYDTYGRMTLRAAIKSSDDTETKWIGNDSSLSDGYVPSSLGSTKFRWGQGFFHDLTTTNSVKESSDKKLKEHIEYLDSKESLEFINHLQPAEYTMIFSENKRVHRGFYAQEVSKTAHELNCRDLSLYSAYVEKDGVIAPYDETEDDENLRWSLSYNEFIAPMVSAIQELSKEIETLKADNQSLKDKIEKLEGDKTEWQNT